MFMWEPECIIEGINLRFCQVRTFNRADTVCSWQQFRLKTLIPVYIKNLYIYHLPWCMWLISEDRSVCLKNFKWITSVLLNVKILTGMWSSPCRMRHLGGGGAVRGAGGGGDSSLCGLELFAWKKNLPSTQRGNSTHRAEILPWFNATLLYLLSNTCSSSLKNILLSNALGRCIITLKRQPLNTNNIVLRCGHWCNESIFIKSWHRESSRKGFNLFS